MLENYHLVCLTRIVPSFGINIGNISCGVLLYIKRKGLVRVKVNVKHILHGKYGLFSDFMRYLRK